MRTSVKRQSLRSAIAQLLVLVSFVYLATTDAVSDTATFKPKNQNASARWSRKTLCAKDLEQSRPALRLIDVDKGPYKNGSQTGIYPRLFCFVNTISVHHETRARSIAETWGQRCDKLVFFSNVSGTIDVGSLSFPVIGFDVPSDHNHLWLKHKASLQYVYDHYRNDYDWFYKADDDAYVIVDNVRAYVRRPEMVMRHKTEPIQVGHRFNLTQDLTEYYIVDPNLEKEFLSRWDRWVFNSGGPGYAMNKLYLTRFVERMNDKTCLSDKMSRMLPDDASISFCMMWESVYPWDTRDYKGRERWHWDKPHNMYMLSGDRMKPWANVYHQNLGGIRNKEDCCAPDSVAFHYIRPHLMYHIERELYFCRASEDIQTLEQYNSRYGLSLGKNVTVYQQNPQRKKKN